MNKQVVEMLRSYGHEFYKVSQGNRLLYEAADEIERLKAALTKIASFEDTRGTIGMHLGNYSNAIKTARDAINPGDNDG